MKGTRKRRWWSAAAIALFCLAVVAFWQSQTLLRLAIVGGAQALGHVHLSFGHTHIGSDRAVFENVHVSSLGNEAIAWIPRLEVGYDLRDLLPGGRRLYGLKSVEADFPHVTIVRHADGTYNVPIPAV